MSRIIRTEWDAKVARAIRYIELLGDTQEARDAAAQNNDWIDTYQWLEASKSVARAQRRAAAACRGFPDAKEPA